MNRIVAIGLISACGHPHVAEQREAVTVDPERDFIATPISTAYGEQTLRALHATGTGYIAIWSDTREAVDAEANPPPTRGYFARVGVDGSVLDPTGVPFEPPGLFPNYAISSACNSAGDCLIVAPATTGVKAVRIHGTQVVASGAIATGATSDFAVAWDGASFRIAWEASETTAMHTAAVQANLSLGAVRDLAVGVVSGLACRGPSECLVTYHAGLGTSAPVRGQVFDATIVGASFPIFANGNHQTATPVWDGTRYWLAMIDLPESSPFTNCPVLAYRIAADGTVVDPSGITVAAASPIEVRFDPHVAFDGATAVVAWTRQVDVVQAGMIARVDPTGAVLDPGGVALTSPESGIWGLACTSGQCLAAWSTSHTNDLAVRGTRVSGIAERDPAGITISTSQPGQLRAKLTFGNGAYFTSWQDTRRSTSNPSIVPLRAAVFTPLGPPTEVELTGGCPFVGRSAAVAATASTFAATWFEGCAGGANAYLQIFAPDLQPIGSTRVVDPSGLAPAIAADGTSMLVVWQTTTGNLLASRYAADGPLLVDKVTVGPGGTPAVAYDGAGAFAVAYTRPHLITNDSDVFIRSIAADGTVGAEVAVADSTPAIEDAPSVACSAGTCVVVWFENHTQLNATWVQASGTVSASLPLGSPGARSAAVTFDGVAFVAAWSTATDIRGARLGIDGTVLEDNIVLAPTPTTPARPALASDGTGRLALLYDRFDPDPAFRSRRLRLRTIDAEGLPPPVDAGVPDTVILPDAPIDAPPDAPIDAPIDAPPDAPIDAPPDAPPDAAIDAPPDAANDAGPPIDAAVPDANVDAPSPPPDAGSHHGGGGGCCSVNDDDGRGWLTLAAMVAMRLRRRTRTTKA